MSNQLPVMSGPTAEVVDISSRYGINRNPFRKMKAELFVARPVSFSGTTSLVGQKPYHMDRLALSARQMRLCEIEKKPISLEMRGKNLAETILAFKAMPNRLMYENEWRGVGIDPDVSRGWAEDCFAKASVYAQSSGVTLRQVLEQGMIDMLHAREVASESPVR